ncbi:MAG: DUF2922 domain-containing protein [Candidatus Caldatribacterium sp.]|nr:DUF2922 domain-containing protein [Candidatus Caldatribacterium sp.]
MAKVLVMTFKNEAGQNVNVRVNYPKDTITGEEVAAVMDTILAKNIFPTTGGDLVEKVGAQIVETTVTVL